MILKEKVKKIFLSKWSLSVILILVGFIVAGIISSFDPSLKYLCFYVFAVCACIAGDARLSFPLSLGVVYYFGHDLRAIFVFAVLQGIGLLGIYFKRKDLEREALLKVDEKINQAFLNFSSVLKQHTHLLKVGAIFINQETSDPEKKKKALRMMEFKADELDKVAKDLWQVSKLSQGESIDLFKTEISLRTLFQEELGRLKKLHPSIAFDLQSIGGLALWNEDGVRRILRELTLNAVQFSEGKEVSVNLLETSSHAEIYVKNEGAPLTKNELEEIFRPLQVLKSGKQQGMKLGLQLTMIKAIVEALGGNITVVSNKVEGTVFKVLLPRFVKDESQKVA